MVHELTVRKQMGAGAARDEALPRTTVVEQVVNGKRDADGKGERENLEKLEESYGKR